MQRQAGRTQEDEHHNNILIAEYICAMPIYAVTDKLFFADKKAAEDPELLKMHGITHILSVAGSPKKCQDIQYL